MAARSTSRDASAERSDRSSASLPGERQAIWTIWATYGAFYFCRTNISSAVPGITTGVSEGGLGLTAVEVGAILASLKLAYAFGQLLNGQLSERFSPRLLLAIGMFGSAAMNLLFGFSTGFYFLLFVWASNGYCQSLGWTPCMRVIANWVPPSRRGKAIGIVGTGYQITLGLSFFIASQSVERFGWRFAFYVPAGILCLAALFMLFFLEESPAHERRISSDERRRAHSPHRRGSVAENILLTLTNPALWLLGIALGFLNACRYGFLDWGIAHLIDVQQSGVGKAGLKYVVLALGAAAGSYLAGWATDRFFGGRRAPVICGLLVCLGGLTLVYESVSRSSPAGTVLLLGVIGFCIYGPQVLLVGTAPADLARRGTAAAAAGFVNFMGYLGAALGDVVTGYLSPEKTEGVRITGEEWQLAIFMWAAWAFAAALCVALLWNATSEEDKSRLDVSN